MKMIPNSVVFALLGLVLTGVAKGEDFSPVSPMPKRDYTARERILEQKSALKAKQARRQELAGMKKGLGVAKQQMKDEAHKMRQQNEQDRQRLQKMKDRARKDQRQREGITPR